MSHATYAQFNTFSRTAHIQKTTPNPAHQSPGDYPRDCGLLDSSNQMSCDNYGFSSQYTSCRLAFAPSIAEGPAYEMYSTGHATGLGQQSPEPGLVQYESSTRSSYSSPPSDYSQRQTQRMQTHVWVTYMHLNFLFEAGLMCRKIQKHWKILNVCLSEFVLKASCTKVLISFWK